MKGLVYFRVDARLIHGQIAAFWTNHVKATRIMVVSDEHATDDIKKATLKMAVPAGVNLSVLTVEKAAANILNGNYETQRVFVIFGEPMSAARLIEAGVSIPALNVGNMSFKAGKHEIVKNVSVGEEDVEAFRKIKASGTRIFHQLVPSNDETDLSSKLFE